MVRVELVPVEGASPRMARTTRGPRGHVGSCWKWIDTNSTEAKRHRRGAAPPKACSMSRMPCKIRRSAIAWESGREPELRDQPGVQPSPPPSVTTVSWLGVETGTRRTRVDGPDSLHTM